MKLNFYPFVILESFVETGPLSHLTKTKKPFNTFRVYDEEEFRKNHIEALKRLINSSKGK